ncbi:hypothetical protein [Exiguobacterium sp. s133]|uniref:hypothetical protein n=1 Tax=Exiguobacterium sp. s133 TaxID=2751213 RepID=UPI001BE70408|nr:hypothetical protein [Exiguobacterium sp. s133]
MRSRFWAAILFTTAAIVSSLVMFTKFPQASETWKLVLAYGGMTFVVSLFFWSFVAIRIQSSRLFGSWMGIFIAGTTVLLVCIARFVIRGDFMMVFKWQAMLGSLTLNFGYVGWVLVIANAIIGFIIGRTRQKSRVSHHQVPRRS